jgi:hypothetical protein
LTRIWCRLNSVIKLEGGVESLVKKSSHFIQLARKCSRTLCLAFQVNSITRESNLSISIFDIVLVTWQKFKNHCWPICLNYKGLQYTTSRVIYENAKCVRAIHPLFMVSMSSKKKRKNWYEQLGQNVVWEIELNTKLPAPWLSLYTQLVPTTCCCKSIVKAAKLYTGYKRCTN